MEQHPIPQQISSYQFKLVGDMTLKQFFQVAGGALIGLLFYSTNLHPVIKWPIILLSTGIGAAMAFLPFQERPLEKWIIAFFRSIYSPTLFTWQKTEKPPVFFTETATAPEITNVGSLNQKSALSPLELAEQTFLGKITSLWGTQQPINNGQQTTVQSQQSQVISPQSAVNSPQSVVNSQPAVSVQVPSQIPTIITKSAPKLVVEETLPQVHSPQSTVHSLDAVNIQQKTITSNEAEFSPDAAPPYPPTIPNTIAGQVMDSQKKIIEGAIMEIKDGTGRPVRALKSNKAGHFIIVTPLANGKYEIITEKDGYTFDPVSFEAKGELIKPIAIRAK
jgi:hypothetical protein